MHEVALRSLYWRTLRIDRTPQAPIIARGQLEDWLGQEHEALFQSQLVVSELVTNALRYAQSSGRWIDLVVPVVLPELCYMQVIDPGNQYLAPTALEPNPQKQKDLLKVSRRGLYIVHKYTRGHWGTYRLPEPLGYRIVWAFVAAKPIDELDMDEFQE